MATGKEALRNLLKASRFDMKLIEPILNLDDDAEVPADFDPEKIASDFLENRKAVAEQSIKLDEKISEALAAQEPLLWKKFVGSIKTKLKKRAGIDFDKGIKETDLDAALEAYETKVGTNQTDSEFKGKFENASTQLTQAIDTIEALKAEKSQLETAKTEFETSYKEQYEVANLIAQELSTKTWAYKGDRLKREQDLFKLDISERFHVKPDGSLIDKKTGLPAMRPDETGRYKHVSEFIDDLGAKYSSFQVANGHDDVNLNGHQQALAAKGKNPDEVKKKVREISEYARQRAKELNMSPEDAAEILGK